MGTGGWRGSQRDRPTVSGVGEGRARGSAPDARPGGTEWVVWEGAAGCLYDGVGMDGHLRLTPIAAYFEAADDPEWRVGVPWAAVTSCAVGYGRCRSGVEVTWSTPDGRQWSAALQYGALTPVALSCLFVAHEEEGGLRDPTIAVTGCRVGFDVDGTWSTTALLGVSMHELRVLGEERDPLLAVPFADIARVSVTGVLERSVRFASASGRHGPVKLLFHGRTRDELEGVAIWLRRAASLAAAGSSDGPVVDPGLLALQHERVNYTPRGAGRAMTGARLEVTVEGLVLSDEQGQEVLPFERIRGVASRPEAFARGVRLELSVDGAARPVRIDFPVHSVHEGLLEAIMFNLRSAAGLTG